jgi:hypothetical protein
MGSENWITSSPVKPEAGMEGFKKPGWPVDGEIAFDPFDLVKGDLRLSKASFLMVLEPGYTASRPDALGEGILAD